MYHRWTAFRYGAIGLLCVLIAAWPVAAQVPRFIKVNAITLEDAGEEVQLSIATSGTARFRSIDVRPNWVVVDVLGAVLGVPAGTLPLAQGPVQKVRVGQFMPDIVRVVVELVRPVKVRLVASLNRGAIIVAIPTDVGRQTPRAPAAASTQSAGPPLPIGQAPHSQAPIAASTQPVGPLPPASQAPRTQALDRTYVLGPDDVIEVTVWGYPDLTRVAAVRPDGMVSVPLAGTVPASARSVDQLTEALSQAYAVYILNPRVSVIVKEFRKIRVSVLGQVARPGTYQLPPGSGILDVLSAAGGATDVAALKEARLLKPGISPQVVDLQSALIGAPAANIRLHGGETLVVPEDLANLVSVTGEVVRPGRYRIKGEMRLLDALLAAGGITERASVTQARLVRASRESESLNLDALLMRQEMSQNIVMQPGDTVFIPEETNNKIYVIGDVNRAGIYPLKGELSLLQAIATAGGPVQHGIGTSKTAYIVRRNGGVPAPGIVASARATQVQPLADKGVLMTVDLEAMMHGDLSRDEPLRPGDVVVVPETGMKVFPSILSLLATIFLGIHP